MTVENMTFLGQEEVQETMLPTYSMTFLGEEEPEPTIVPEPLFTYPARIIAAQVNEEVDPDSLVVGEKSNTFSVVMAGVGSVLAVVVLALALFIYKKKRSTKTEAVVFEDIESGDISKFLPKSRKYKNNTLIVMQQDIPQLEVDKDPEHYESVGVVAPPHVPEKI
jgi:hypothetical protein